MKKSIPIGYKTKKKSIPININSNPTQGKFLIPNQINQVASSYLTMGQKIQNSKNLKNSKFIHVNTNSAINYYTNPGIDSKYTNNSITNSLYNYPNINSKNSEMNGINFNNYFNNVSQHDYSGNSGIDKNIVKYNNINYKARKHISSISNSLIPNDIHINGYQSSKNNNNNSNILKNNSNIDDSKIKRTNLTDPNISETKTNLINNIEQNTSVRKKKKLKFVNNVSKENIQEIKELYENMILKLNEEDKLRDEEIRLHTINMNKNLENMEKKNKNLKKNNYTLIKKFMDLKYDTNLNNQKLKDEIEMTKLQGEALQGSINELKKKTKMDKEISKKDYDKRSRQVASTLRTQVKTKEESANLAMRQFNDIQQMYEDKINEAKNKYKTTENKFLLLKDGYFNEEENQKKLEEVEQNIRLFRAKMKEFEKYINDIKKLSKGDYDHYYEIQKMTSDKNEQFFRESEIVDEQLREFQIILNERQKENNQILKDINEHFDENGMIISNGNDNNMNRITEEKEEK